MPVRRAGDIENIRVFKDLRVAVRAGDHHEDPVALAQRFAVEIMFARHSADKTHRRAVEAHHLFYRARRQIGFGEEPLQLLGVAQEGQRAVTDQVRRRLMPCKEHQNAGRDNYIVGKLIALIPRLDQVHDEAGPRRGAEVCYQRAEETRHLLTAPLRAGIFVIRPPGAADKDRHIVGPAFELVQPLARDVQQVHNDESRDLKRVVGDEVDPPPPLQPVEQQIDDRRDPRLDRLHGAPGEGVAHDAPHPCVIRRVAESDPEVQVMDDFTQLLRIVRRQLAIETKQPFRAQPVAQQQVAHIGVARDDPAFHHRVPVNRVLRPQSGEPWIRVRHMRRIRRIEN